MIKSRESLIFLKVCSLPAAFELMAKAKSAKGTAKHNVIIVSNNVMHTYKLSSFESFSFHLRDNIGQPFVEKLKEFSHVIWSDFVHVQNYLQNEGK